MPKARTPVAWGAAGLLGAAALAGNAPLEVIAVSGASAPGTESGTTFDSFAAPAINDSGTIAFVANLAGSATGPTGVYIGSPGAWNLVAREGQTLPSGLGQMKSLASSPLSFNAAGQVVFVARSGSGDGITRVFRASASGGVIAIASAGQQAPGLALGVSFRDFGDPVINSVGQITFNASLQGPGIDSTNQGSIWLYSAGVLQPVLKGGDIPNVLQPTTTVRELMLPLLNGAGKLAFGGIVQGPLVAPINETARWTANGWVSSLQVVGGTLVPLSDDGGGYVIRRVLPGMHRMNSGGTIAFFADHDDATAPPQFAHSIWLTGSTGIVPIVMRNTSLIAPGEQIQIAAFSSVAIDGGSGVHFKATVRGANVTDMNDHGYFTRRADGSVVQRMRSGQIAPGMNSPRTMLELSPYAAIGAGGELIVSAPLSGFVPGVRYDRVLIVNYPDGTISKIVATGDTITVGGTPKTISVIGNYYAGNGQDGLASTINSGGTVVLRLRFSDNSWAMVRTTIRPPCPGDLNGDRQVDDDDFLSFAQYYNDLAPGAGDLNHDGVTDDSDFVVFSTTYDRFLCP